MKGLLQSQQFGLASIAGGVSIAVAGVALLPTDSRLLGPIVIVIGFAWLLIGIVIFAKSLAPEKHPQHGQGGRGGSATVKGNGLAIGGPGGSAGTHGSGGDGGGGSVEGDGISVGGSGGHAGQIGVWKPPAPSGCVVLARTQGTKPDPYLSQFGTGGVDPEYSAKLAVVREIEKTLNAPSVSFVAEAHPSLIPEINAALAASGADWRVRIDDAGFDYEFFRIAG